MIRALSRFTTSLLRWPETFEPDAFEPSLRTELLILQPTPFCNLDCDYCYLPNRDSRRRMSLETIGSAAQRLLDDGLVGPQLTVVWHAGEPLVVPPSYYASAFALLDEILGPHCELSHSIQTNATLIDDGWCSLFREHPVRVGVSIDGPAHLHDRHRKTRQGKGTHSDVLNGIKTLQRHGVPLHVIAVITADSLAFADEIYDFFSDQGIRDIGFNFDEAEGTHARSSLEGKESDLAAFLQRMLERSNYSEATTCQIRELVSAHRVIIQGLPEYCWRGESWPYNAQTIPFRIVTVGWNGDFSTFSPELLGQRSKEFNGFVLGNVLNDGFLESSAKATFQKLWWAIHSGTGACRDTCAHFKYCGGGAPVNKFYESGDFSGTETLYCRAMVQLPFDVILNHIEKIIEADFTPEYTSNDVLKNAVDTSPQLLGSDPKYANASRDFSPSFWVPLLSGGDTLDALKPGVIPRGADLTTEGPGEPALLHPISSRRENL